MRKANMLSVNYATSKVGLCGYLFDRPLYGRSRTTKNSESSELQRGPGDMVAGM